MLRLGCERVAEVDDTCREDGLTLVTFRVADVRFAIEARCVAGSCAGGGGDTQGDALNARAWLNLQGGDDTARPAQLRLKPGWGGQTLIVDGPIELVELPARCIHPLPHAIAATTRLRGLRAIAFDAAGLLLILSVGPPGA